MTTSVVEAAEAVAVCAGCDVRAECVAAALKDPNLLGVWGGPTTRERRELRAAGAADSHSPCPA